MYLQGVDDIMDVEWGGGVTWGDLNREAEREFSRFNFEKADVPLHFEMFDRLQREAMRMLGEGLILPAYDYVVKCSHIFNILDARGAVSVSERTSYIARIRDLARQTAEAYVADRRAARISAARARARRHKGADVKKDFLLEIGCENLPSGYLDEMIEQLRKLFEGGIRAERIPCDGIAAMGTPEAPRRPRARPRREAGERRRRRSSARR